MSDYTRQVAAALAEAGDEVHVWAPPLNGARADEGGRTQRDRVHVHRLPDHFGPRGLAALDRDLRRLPPTRRLLVQYVPHAFGHRAMNLPFCLWLWLRSQRRRDRIWTMFHEVAFPWRSRQPAKHNLLAAVTRSMAFLVARASRQIFVSIPAWQLMLRPLASPRTRITWAPVPSNLTAALPGGADAAGVRARLGAGERIVIGHFGTFGASLRPLLHATIPCILRPHPRALGLLLGRGSREFSERLLADHPDLRNRVLATGELPQDELTAHLMSCDLLVQPYPDGVSTRRSSLMAGLRLGVPIVTTEGALSEPLWRESGAVALCPADDVAAIARAASDLMANSTARAQLGARGAALYAAQFGIEYTVRLLRDPCDVGASPRKGALAK